MACHALEGIPMNPTVTWLIVIVGLCVLFPPLLGFVAGIGFACAIRWLWMKVCGV
jgi:hypothetical protein